MFVRNLLQTFTIVLEDQSEEENGQKYCIKWSCKL